ncbi:hypothetical protein N0V82_003943 [Gnomoniopsis sp. IMI 355080]|nr:hypothetical protein N0V82_003943 [Gnomoniopsis sp. IMI 355080]
MILRSSALRHGRQALSTTARRAASTDHRQPFSLPTTLAEPPQEPLGIPAKDALNSASAPPSTLTTPEVKAPLWQAPTGASPLALWNRKRKIKVDKKAVEDFRVKVKLEKTTDKLGSAVVERFDPSALLRDPPRPEDVTLELLMSSQTHMGHHKSLWNPANQRYIYGVRSDIHIISLEETAAALRRAAKVVEEVAYLGGLILFVGNRKGQMEITARVAELAGACHLFTKWVPGTITNRDQILGKEELKMVNEKDEAAVGFERHLLERRPLMPDLVVCLNPLENFVLLHECAQENIPTIGLIDTDADPTKVTYVIPGNDDSLRSVSLVAGVLGRAGEAGQARRKADASRGLCTWRNPPEVETWITNNIQHLRQLTQGGEAPKEDSDDKEVNLLDEVDVPVEQTDLWQAQLLKRHYPEYYKALMEEENVR